jgi:hypothetical protein
MYVIGNATDILVHCMLELSVLLPDLCAHGDLRLIEQLIAMFIDILCYTFF